MGSWHAESDAALADELVGCGIPSLLPALLRSQQHDVQLAALWLCINLQRQCAQRSVHCRFHGSQPSDPVFQSCHAHAHTA